jgi:acyl dehydratase
VETDPLYEEVAALLAEPPSPPIPARDPVNQPMIRHWCDAMGDDLPVYVSAEAARAAGHPDVVAPPAALQMWTMPGLKMRGIEDASTRAHKVLMAAGYIGVVATDSRQTYHRYLTLGDEVTATTRLDDVSRRKQTALGIGYFVTSVTEYRDQNGELVGEMFFRTLWFRPGTGRSATTSASTEGGAL